MNQKNSGDQLLMVQQFVARQGYRAGYIALAIGFTVFLLAMITPNSVRMFAVLIAGCMSLYILWAAKRYFFLGYRVYQAQRYALTENFYHAQHVDDSDHIVDMERWKVTLTALQKKQINRQAWTAPMAWAYGLPVNENAFRQLRKVYPKNADRIAFFNQFNRPTMGLLVLLPGVRIVYERWMALLFLMKPTPLKVTPKLQSYVWGPKGKHSAIFKFLHQLVPKELEEVPVAEMWVGAHYKNPSLITYKNYRIPMNAFLEQTASCVLGQGRDTMKTLFKILEADTALSWQMHDKFGEEAKNETWTFFIDNEMVKQASSSQVLVELYIGFRKQEEMDKNLLKDFISAQDWTEDHYRSAYIKALQAAVYDKQGEKVKAFSNHISIKAENGKVVLYLNEKLQSEEVVKKVGLDKNILTVNIPGATVHALVKGVAYEIQKMADKTMRLYDHGRRQSGRPLHIEEAQLKLDCCPRDVLDYISLPITESVCSQNLVMTSVYLMDRVSLFSTGVMEKKFILNGCYQLLIVQSGTGRISSSQIKESIQLKGGELWLIPAALKDYNLSTEHELELLKITERNEQDAMQKAVSEKRQGEFWNN